MELGVRQSLVKVQLGSKERLTRRGLLTGEVEERGGRVEFLPLEDQRRPGPKQQQRRRCAVSGRRGDPSDPVAPGGVRNLVVVLKIADEPGVLDAE